MIRRALLAVGLCVATVAEGSAGEIKLPPISGNLSGDFMPDVVPGSPKLHWTVTVAPATDGSETRTAETTVAGQGTNLRAGLNLSSTQHGSWRIAESEIDLATWFPAVKGKIGDVLQGIEAAGTVVLTGNGTIREGSPSGTVQLQLKHGRIGSVDQGWSLDDVTLSAELLLEAAEFKARSTTPFELTVGTISTSRFGARNVFIQGVLKEDRTIAVSEARVEIAGGNIKLDPTILALTPLAVETTIHILNVGMQDIAALVPTGLSSAQGRIDGTVRMAWSLAQGFRIGAGELNLGASEPAVVHLAPVPGFLTRTMPKRFEPIPAWTGPLGKWLSADNPVYTNMEDIELGRAPLHVESLRVRLTPEGDERGRTAVVQMTARPAKAGASVKSVKFDVNVAGPLDSILKLGLNENFSIGTR